MKKTYTAPLIEFQEMLTLDCLLLAASAGGSTDEVLSRGAGVGNDDEGSASRSHVVWENDDVEDSW